MGSDGRERVVAVVVAYNRRDLLAETLDALTAQTEACHRVVVVDNASTDDSAEVAQTHPIGADVVRLERNTGGAGGFAVGLARALDVHGADAVWLMDDDTVPTGSALQALMRVRRSAIQKPALLASKVVWTDGAEHPMNRPRRRPGRRTSGREAELGLTPVRSASFVSLLVDADHARATALPVADYFIWNDDFEYSTRLLRRGRGYSCAESVVVHKTRVFGSTDADPGERFFYEVRNKVWLFRFSRGLAPAEKALYGASTLRRWLRTLARSRRRGVLLRAGGRGWTAAWSTRPRTDDAALADVPTAALVLQGFDRVRHV